MGCSCLTIIVGDYPLSRTSTGAQLMDFAMNPAPPCDYPLTILHWWLTIMHLWLIMAAGVQVARVSREAWPRLVPAKVSTHCFGIFGAAEGSDPQRCLWNLNHLSFMILNDLRTKLKVIAFADSEFHDFEWLPNWCTTDVVALLSQANPLI